MPATTSLLGTTMGKEVKVSTVTAVRATPQHLARCVSILWTSMTHLSGKDRFVNRTKEVVVVFENYLNRTERFF